MVFVDPAAGEATSAGPFSKAAGSSTVARGSTDDRSKGALIHTTTPTADVTAIGASQRTVDVFHHLRSGTGGAVFAIAASIA
jgi:hypothetical protein